MRARSRQVALLSRHFFWRFLDNDLLSPDADIHETATLGLAFLAVPSLLCTGLLLFIYATPFVTPYQRMMTALPDKLMYVSWSMLVMALVTIIAWDALSLDSRDYAILGTLPIASGTLLSGKLGAIVLFFTAIAAAVNGIPTVLFPLVSLSATALTLPVEQAFRMVAGHAASCLGAALFGFFAVLALRGLLLLALGPRLFRRVSLPVQFVVVLGLAIGFLSTSSASLKSGGAAVWLSPPMWFLGLYETITGPTMFRAAGMWQMKQWQITRELEARDAYLSFVPAFHELARTAAVALAVAAVAGLGLYFLAHFRHASCLRQMTTSEPARRRRLRERLARLARRVVVRDSLAQASFFFTLQTLGRSARHKLYLAAYMAAALLVNYIVLAPTVIAHPERLSEGPIVPTLSFQLVLSFALLAGLRTAFTIPAELRANWIFRLTAVGDRERYLRGVRKAIAACMLAPLFVVLVPLHAVFWGIGPALLHAAAGSLWAAVLLEAVTIELDKFPFTCARSASRDSKLAWPMHVLVFVVYCYWFASWELAAIPSFTSLLKLFLSLVALLVILQVVRLRRQVRRADFVFAEPAGGEVITLDL